MGSVLCGAPTYYAKQVPFPNKNAHLWSRDECVAWLYKLHPSASDKLTLDLCIPQWDFSDGLMSVDTSATRTEDSWTLHKIELPIRKIIADNGSYNGEWISIYYKLTHIYTSSSLKYEQLDEIAGSCTILGTLSTFHEYYFESFIHLLHYKKRGDREGWMSYAKKYEERMGIVLPASYTSYLDNDALCVLGNRVKLVVTDIYRPSETARQCFRKVVSPFLSTLPIAPFGMYHTSLIVGPWYVGWSNSELVIPKTLCSKKIMCVLDIGAVISSISNLKTIALHLSRILWEWNVRYEYSTVYAANRSGNCQHFVECVLSALGMSIEDNCLFQQIRMGSRDIRFVPSRTLREKIRDDKACIPRTTRFCNHATLDTYIWTFWRQLSECPVDLSVLRSMDRVFSLRHLSDPEDVNASPCKRGCPFTGLGIQRRAATSKTS